MLVGMSDRRCLITSCACNYLSYSVMTFDIHCSHNRLVQVPRQVVESGVRRRKIFTVDGRERAAFHILEVFELLGGILHYTNRDEF